MSVRVTCNLIGATIWRDILLIYSALAPEDNWIDAAHAWVFVVNTGGLRVSITIFENLSLTMLPSDTLKATHESTKMEFMW